MSEVSSNPTPIEIAAATAEFRSGWTVSEYRLREEWAIDSQVELMASILVPMGKLDGIIPETEGERIARHDAEREQFIGEAIEPLVKLLFNKNHHHSGRPRKQRSKTASPIED